jgi:hypothetical protein
LLFTLIKKGSRKGVCTTQSNSTFFVSEYHVLTRTFLATFSFAPLITWVAPSFFTDLSFSSLMSTAMTALAPNAFANWTMLQPRLFFSSLKYTFLGV